MNTLKRWHEVIEQGNPEPLDDILAEDCVFFPRLYIHRSGARRLPRFTLPARCRC